MSFFYFITALPLSAVLFFNLFFSKEWSFPSHNAAVQNSLSESLRKKQQDLSLEKSKESSQKLQKTKETPSAPRHSYTPVHSKKTPSSKCTTELSVQGAIGPGSLDQIQHALKTAEKNQCTSILLLINTPGGSLLSTRKIVEVILNSEIPFLCLIYPNGAHAGSAGAIIMQACHVNGAVTAANLGAATPIMGMGRDMSKDLRNKMVNDTSSWLDSLTELRKRNKKFGREIVTKAKAVPAHTAYQIGAIDFFGKTKEDFLNFAHGRTVKVKDNKSAQVFTGAVQAVPQGFRYHFVQFVTDPELVYLIFIGSLMLIYFEITHTGFILPGVLGVIGLIVAFIGMHKLSFVWGGVLLILLGLVFMILEAFIVSFGVLGLSGAASFIAGSLFLFDPSKTGGLSIPLSTIIITSVIFSVISIGLAYLAVASLRKSRKKEEEKWVGKEGEVVKVLSGAKGLMEIQGETWKYKSNQELKKGDIVQIKRYSGLVFEVQKSQNS